MQREYMHGGLRGSPTTSVAYRVARETLSVLARVSVILPPVLLLVYFCWVHFV